MMPKGVEHQITTIPLQKKIGRVSLPMMPKGVEHFYKMEHCFSFTP